MSDIERLTSALPPRGVKPRIAEENDTQNAIDREDADRHRRGKRTDTDMPQFDDVYEDLTEVSIALLRGFLQNLIATKIKVRDIKRTAPAPNYAMQAYRNAGAQTPQTEAPQIADDAEIGGFTRLDLAAETLDRAEIDLILTQLDKLEQAGISYISMQRSTSFLQSIREAITRAV